ncbi:MAG: D-glycerate dehydrogenase [Candidatus Delongbacteria bacterium]|nr:D-glycerate dehydrogenase [Candidatus Delongbacteria bacterium]
MTSPLPGDVYRRFLGDPDYEIRVMEPGESGNLERSLTEFNPQGMVTLLSDRMDSARIQLAPAIQVISNYAVGYNNIDVEYAKDHGIVVTNTPGVLTDATADVALMLILMASRRAVECERLTRTGQFTGWTPGDQLGLSIQHKTLGIIGLGRIGQAVAQRAQAFGMKIVYHQRRRLEPDREKQWNAVYVSLDELLRISDVVSLHLPYTPAVHHLIDNRAFDKMKSTAILINTARGPLVDENALAEALIHHRIWAAGLDVYEHEPAVHSDLRRLDQVVLLPHIGSATQETRAGMTRMVIDDLTAVLNGRRPHYQVV